MEIRKLRKNNIYNKTLILSMTDVDSETLVLARPILLPNNEFNIDALIEDFINIETGIFMSLSNHDKILVEGRRVVIQEFEGI